jgi:hypothetical protein
MTQRTQYTGSLVSPNVIAKPDGSRIWRDQTITTSGPALYAKGEIDGSGSREMVTVVKPIEEITSRGFLASCEGIPILLRHGVGFVDALNWRDRSYGHLQNVRVAPDRDSNGNVQIIGDVHVKDQFAIGQAETNLRGLSVAYTYSIDFDEQTGTFIQRNLRANHLALVDSPRMQSARLTDSENEEIEVDTVTMNRLCDLLEKLLEMNGVKAETDARDPDQIPMIASQPGKGAASKRFSDLTPVSALSKKERSTNPLGSDDSTDLSGMISTLQGGGAEIGDALRTYDHLKSIRNAIAGTGDVGLILSFNGAMTAVKSQLGQLVTKLPTGRAFALDTRTDGGSRGEFENSCRDMRSRLLGEATPGDANSYYRRVQLGRDSAQADGGESYETMMARFRQQMLSTRP